MKKIISIALLSAIFGMVGCSTQGKQGVADRDVTTHKAKSQSKRANHHGKFGVEKTEKDTTK